MDEIEVKILGIEPTRIKRLLKQHKAKFIKRVLQRNTIYENEYAKANRIVVRVREEGKHGKVTIKANRRTVGGHKVQDETEFTLDPAQAHKVFKQLGYKVFAVNELKREYYELLGCSVEFCTFPGIPTYIEIEGTKPAIKRVAKILGYDETDYEPRTVFEIYGLGSGSLVFKRQNGT